MRNVRALVAAVAALVVGAVGIGATPAAAASPEEDVDLVVSRLQDYYLAQGDEVILANGILLARTSEALDYVASQNEDGSWSDVDYADRTSSANGRTWSAYLALYRMLAMAQAYRDPDAAGYEDPAVLDAVEEALRYWDEADPGNTNWWETEIGESIAMGRLSVFLGDVLAEDAYDVTLEHNVGRLDPVGANGAWRTTNYLFEAVATRDVDAIRAGYDTMVQTVAVDDSGAVNEAVQPDNSFWAHGAQLYSEGYGMALFTMVALWADVSRGTSLAFTRDDLDVVARYIVGGTRWMIREEIGMLNLGYRPPETTDGLTSYAADFIEPLTEMVRTDPLYARSYRAMLDNILGTRDDNGVTGNRYFWRSEFDSHLRDGYGIFTKLNSSRTVGGEYRSTFRPSVGNEIYWNASGATAIQVTNREYTDLFPAFDWFHYPGVTAPYAKEQSLGPAGRLSNGGSFTGGVSDGTYGATVFTLDRADTVASKSYYYFDDEMVALGTGIASGRDVPVHTTVNQAAAASNASVDGTALALGDEIVAEDPSWAYNDRVGYVFPGDEDVHVSRASQTGAWLNQDAVSRDAFTLYVDHGVEPEDAGYEYVVLPDAEPNEVRNYATHPAVEILRNDDDVQAVQHRKLRRTMATFYAAGRLDLGDGRALEVSAPSIVLLDESGRTPVVSIANPDRPNLRVEVTLTDKKASSHGTFVLGAGASLGKTVTGELAGGVGSGSDWTASSSTVDHGPALAGDGDSATTWHSDGDGTAWLETRLEPGSYLSGLTLEWGEDFATRYLVQTSTDGSTWEDRQLVQDGDGGTETVTLSPSATGYVRVVLLDSAAGAGFGVRELTPTASVDLALGRPVSASGGSAADAATDGSLETRWIGNLADDAWVQVDLGSVQPISTVRLWWEASYAKQYTLQVSDDGETWREVYATSGTGSDGGTDVLSVDAEGRYVRMQTVSRSIDRYGVSMWEFEVFADDALVDAPEPEAVRPNLALGRPVTADSQYSASLAASNAVDGNLTTRWASLRQDAPYTTERWLQVDLGEVRTVNQAKVAWEAATSNDYRIEGSLDGQTWERLARVEKTSSELKNTVDFDPAQVRYVRLIGLPATKYGLSVYELELYGGYTLSCADDALTATPDGTTVLGASISPYDAGDTFSAWSLDPAVADVTGGPTADADGTLSVDLSTGVAGTTSVLIAHADGGEFVRCTVKVEVDTSALEELVAEADALDSTAYTARTWAPLLPALEDAKALIASPEAVSTEDLGVVWTALADAMKGLKVVRPAT